MASVKLDCRSIAGNVGVMWHKLNVQYFLHLNICIYLYKFIEKYVKQCHEILEPCDRAWIVFCLCSKNKFQEWADHRLLWCNVKYHVFTSLFPINEANRNSIGHKTQGEVQKGSHGINTSKKECFGRPTIRPFNFRVSPSHPSETTLAKQTALMQVFVCQVCMWRPIQNQGNLSACI